MNMGIGLYNKVPDHIKKLDKIICFKKELKSFLSQCAFYLVVVFRLCLLYVKFISLISAVVKVLCYKSGGRWFDPSWCHWIFH